MLSTQEGEETSTSGDHTLPLETKLGITVRVRQTTVGPHIAHSKNSTLQTMLFY